MMDVLFEGGERCFHPSELVTVRLKECLGLAVVCPLYPLFGYIAGIYTPGLLAHLLAFGPSD